MPQSCVPPIPAAPLPSPSRSLRPGAAAASPRALHRWELVLPLTYHQSGAISIAAEGIYESVLSVDGLRGRGGFNTIIGGLDSNGRWQDLALQRQPGSQCRECSGCAKGFAQCAFWSANRQLFQAIAEDLP